MRAPFKPTRQHFVYTVIILACAWGLFCSLRELSILEAKRKVQPYTFGGDIFAGVKGATGSEQYIGYMTDRDIKDDKVSARLTQAQFTLAPLILDFNNPDHRLLILDFQDPKNLAGIGQKFTLRLLKRGPQGIALAERLRP